MRMQAIVSSLIPRLLVAAILAMGITALVERAAPVVTAVVMFVLLTAALLLAFSLTLSLLASRRFRVQLLGGGRGHRQWWPFGQNGRGMGGVREPRRPRPPFFPPRTAAAELDTVSRDQ